MRWVAAAALLTMMPSGFAATAAQASASSPAGKDADRMVCKIDPADTESRIKRRICKTASEWKGEGGSADSTSGGKKQEPRN